MRLTFFAPPKLADARPLYTAIVAEARRPDWYRDAQVPDTLDGRFAVLTSLLALADLRLEQGGEEARALAPRLAERFVADMDAQMREAGFGDPGLGKQVRKMVGALAGRVERWRAVADSAAWDEVARASLYGDSRADTEAAAHGVAATRDWWRRLREAPDKAVMAGRIE